MIQLFTELQEKKNVRSNLSALRASLKEATEEQKAQAIEFVRGHEDLVFGFLQEEDAKTRKNAALLLGDLAVQNALQPLWKAYTREQTLFVKSAYLEAMKALHAEEILSQLSAQQLEHSHAGFFRRAGHRRKPETPGSRTAGTAGNPDSV